ncbi:hypothetical protein NC651_011678 [Populus alba x Populus x berolinensis]|nr:hypothetical protein NC651_011678 [Populus alba x Populus x berolinensis]
MAATFASASAVVGLGSGSLSSPSRISSPKKICLSSGFVKSPVTARNPLGAGTGGLAAQRPERDRVWIDRVASTVKHTGNWWQEPDWALLREHRDRACSLPHPSSAHFSVLVVVGDLAPRAIHLPYIWANWLQGED